MELQETYRFLNSITDIENEIAKLTNKRDRLMFNLTGGAIRYDIDRVQTTPKDAMLDTWADICELDDKIKALMKKQIKAVKDVSAAIAMVGGVEGRVLSDYYVGARSMKVIADSIGYATTQTYRFRKRGVEILHDIMDDSKDGKNGNS